MRDVRDLLRDGLGDLRPSSNALERTLERIRIRRRNRRVAAIGTGLALALAALVLVWTAFRPAAGPMPAAGTHGAIAFERGNIVAGSSKGALEIYVMEPDGSDVRKLTDASADGKVAAEPAWSPDGTKIAFVLSTPEHLGAYAGDGNIYIMDADGTRLTQLTQGLRAAHPAWSPDGSELVFVRDQGNSVVTMNADGSDVREVRLDGEAYPPYQSPAWSPDGARIAFQASPSRGVDTNSVYVTTVDGSGTTRITPGWSDGSPAWSPDGNTLAYAGPDGIYLHDLQAGTDHRLTTCGKEQDCGFDFEPSWAPDGSRLVFTRQDYGGRSVQIFVVNSDGKGVQQLTVGPGDSSPSWQPIPGAPVSPSPTVSVTRCVQARTSGDFDGDGTVDEAEFVDIAAGEVSCDRRRDVFSNLVRQEVDVRFQSGQTLDQPLTDCEPCLTGGLVFTAADLDGDGRDELAIDVGPGAATDYVEFYRVDPSGIRPLTVAEPGDPPQVEPGPAVLGGGFDSGQWSPTECRAAPDGTRQLISVHAENLTGPITGPWKVHTTTMALEGDRLVVTSTKDQESDNFLRTAGVFQNGCS
jgi:Tol biopolymer transport system component